MFRYRETIKNYFNYFYYNVNQTLKGHSKLNTCLKYQASISLYEVTILEKEIFDVIHNRKSIRQFTNEQISRADLQAIAEAARATPTSVNLQTRTFTMVQNKILIQKLGVALRTAIGHHDVNFYNADSLLLISVPAGYPYSQIETGLAVQNAYLAATAFDLGTTWTDQIRNQCDNDQVRAVLREMKIPDSHICWTVLPIGVPDSQPMAKERTEPITIIE